MDWTEEIVDYLSVGRSTEWLRLTETGLVTNMQDDAPLNGKTHS